ncbi:MAG: hypothetical protein V2B19_26965 [Pseudomonadota bacterium]
MKMIQKTGHGLLIWAIGLWCCTQSFAAVSDIGMVTRLDGKVTFWNDTDGQARQAAQNFMKVRSDDRFDLEAGAQLQLVFFASGRKELWKGPSSLKMGGAGCVAMETGKTALPPQVTIMPETVSKEMQRISPLIDPEKLHRSGSTTVRGKKSRSEGVTAKSALLTDEERRLVEAARNTYKTLGQGFDSDDITPELYLFSVLADYDQSEEMDSLLKRMREKQPGAPVIERLTTWLNSQR